VKRKYFYDGNLFTIVLRKAYGSNDNQYNQNIVMDTSSNVPLPIQAIG
jgi:hypothetical protein